MHCGVGTRGFITDEQYERMLPHIGQLLAKRGVPGVARAWLVGLFDEADSEVTRWILTTAGWLTEQ